MSSGLKLGHYSLRSRYRSEKIAQGAYRTPPLAMLIEEDRLIARYYEEPPVELF